MRERTPAMWQRIVLTVVLLALGAVFLEVMGEHYAIEDWLFWRYARYWLWCIVMCLGSLGTGEWVVLRLVGRIRGLHAHLFVSFCTGLLLFGLSLFVAGLLRLYGPTLFYALPLSFLGLGLPRLWALRRDLLPRVQRLTPLDVRGIWALVIIIFGMYAWLMIYAMVLHPDNVMFDSRWKHLAIAESFAADGGIFRFPQGWMFAARPHFASYLYTWAFLIPDGELFDQIVLCGHIEFVVVVVTTLVGIPAMVRRIVPDADPKLVWVARFLFPGVFLYDSNLSIGADHVAAVFAIPIFLVTHDLLRRHFDVRYAILLGMMTAGILLTKETAAAVTIPSAAVVIIVGAARQAWRARGQSGPFFARHRWIPAFLAIAVVGLTVSSPLWLKNLIWYGDPLYPSFYKYFEPRPWLPDSEYQLTWGFYDYQFSLWHDDDKNQWWETLKVLFTWSFVPHDWGTFHGKRPVIGSLLTMLLPVMLFVRGTKRLWITAAWIHIGIVMWFRVLPQDRYLQVLMPWMAAWTAAALIIAWRARVRVAIIALVGAQIVWGGDVYFLHRNLLDRVVKLFKASRKDETMEKRLDTQKSFGKIGKYMPEGSRLIVHEIHPHLGTGVPTYSDFQTYQFGLSYGLLHSPREVWDAYQELGITHLWWAHQKSKAWDSVAGDIMFFDMALRHTVKRKKFGGSWVAELPAEPPEDEASFEDTVVVLGCTKRRKTNAAKAKAKDKVKKRAHTGYASGLYRVRDLTVSQFGPEATDYPEPRLPANNQTEALKLAESATYAVLDPRCARTANKRLPTGFRLAAKRRRVGKLKNRGYHIYIRLKGEPEPWPEGELEVDTPARPVRGKGKPSAEDEARPSAPSDEDEPTDAGRRDDDDPATDERDEREDDANDDDRSDDEDAAADDGRSSDRDDDDGEASADARDEDDRD